MVLQCHGALARELDDIGRLVMPQYLSHGNAKHPLWAQSRQIGGCGTLINVSGAVVKSELSIICGVLFDELNYGHCAVNLGRSSDHKRTRVTNC